MKYNGSKLCSIRHYLILVQCSSYCSTQRHYVMAPQTQCNAIIKANTSLEFTVLVTVHAVNHLYHHSQPPAAVSCQFPTSNDTIFWSPDITSNASVENDTTWRSPNESIENENDIVFRSPNDSIENDTVFRPPNDSIENDTVFRSPNDSIDNDTVFRFPNDSIENDTIFRSSNDSIENENSPTITNPEVVG